MTVHFMSNSVTTPKSVVTDSVKDTRAVQPYANIDDIEKDELDISSKKEIDKEGTKKSSLWQKFKHGYTNFKKGLVTVGEYALGTVKGLAYGGLSALGVLTFYSVKNVFKKTTTIPLVGKVIAGAVGVGVFALNILNAHLNANTKKADIDHRWQTGHNEG